MISIVVCTVTPTKLQALRTNLDGLLGDEPHEFVVITDAKSMAEGCNRGIRQSTGDRIILCHDDIEILAADFRQKLDERLGKYDLIGVAGSTRLAGPTWAHAGPPHIFGKVAEYVDKEQCYYVGVWGAPAAVVPGVCLLDGVFLAGPRHTFESIQFDEQTFHGFHHYDLDFTYRAASAGLKLAVCNDFMFVHHSQGQWNQTWFEEAKRFIAKHHKSFHPSPITPWSPMRIKVPSREQLAEFLECPQWKDSEK